MTKQLTAADPRDGLPPDDGQTLRDLDHVAETGRLGGNLTTLARNAADLIRRLSVAHARPEAVDEAMVERAYAAFRKHVPSKGHRAGFKQQLHAALTAALTPERAP